ncbi:uncharacterized protein G2W53_028608 [Senna tora]|uniref:Uncharacterized protein n=1 Tax=Senna tora TaxID=362788 RepID=A0A834WEY6_9FABA|nr:uncharacterized protein G2W53_028608 [Senna tora]
MASYEYEANMNVSYLSALTMQCNKKEVEWKSTYLIAKSSTYCCTEKYTNLNKSMLVN